MIYVTCRQTAKNRDQLRNPTLGNRVRATFTFLLRPRCRKAESIVMRVSVCPRAYLRNYVHVRSSPILRMLPVVVVRSSAGGVAIRYVFPVYGLAIFAHGGMSIPWQRVTSLHRRVQARSRTPDSLDDLRCAGNHALWVGDARTACSVAPWSKLEVDLCTSFSFAYSLNVP